MNHNTSTARTITFIGLLGALSTVLMMFDFAIPLAPSFMKFDISELPALFAGFYLGPVSGSLTVLVKIILKILFKGSSTAFVGEAINLAGSICFVLPAALIYRKMHTKKGAVISLIAATLIASFAYVLMNNFVAFPMYGRIYGLSNEVLVGMADKANPLVTIDSMLKLMLLSVLPFNLFKYGVTSIVTYLLYKRVGVALQKIVAPAKSVKA